MTASASSERLRTRSPTAVEWALELCHPEVEFFSLMAQLDASPYRGYAGIRRFFRDVDASWDEWGVEVEQLVSAPDAS